MGKLIVVGDRVLISPDTGDRKTEAGLVLPASVAQREKVGSGLVVGVGPGYATANPEFSEGDVWKSDGKAVRYLPLQAEAGDFAFFLRKDAVEIEFEGDEYLILPHSAILALVRNDADDILKSIRGKDGERGEEEA